MTVKVENDELVIRLPLQPATPSKTGKTLLVATSHGLKVTEAVVNGKPVTVGLNAFISR
jgi:hypothetical protein